MHKVVVRHRFDLLSGFAPGAQSSNDHERFESLFPQHVRHPGAGCFACSSTVDINVFVLGEQLDFFQQVVRFQPDRAFYARRRRIVVAMAAHIHQ
jgi:hypothetical protein